MHNKYIAVITAENKENYIAKTIESCLGQTNNNNLRIVVIYSNLKNETKIKKKFQKKKILFLKCPLKKLPMHDQLYKIEKVLKLFKNKWVLLLDGDDLFKFNKIQIIDELNLKKDKVYLNNHVLFNPNQKIDQKKLKIYKNWNLYKKLFNDWPQKINTSSIIIHSKLLKKFYKYQNPYKWKYLAVDVQLILFAHYAKKLIFINKVLTLKRENINNIDKTFSNYLKKKFWLRRYEQHNLTRELSKKNNTIDRIITIFFKNITRYLS